MFRYLFAQARQNQLFRGIDFFYYSRLHHPEPYVRNAITELLERIASERPDDVVFAVVVASNKTDARIDASLRSLNEEKEEKSEVS